jgi:transcriptional regulator with XRE-family HTH domain
MEYNCTNENIYLNIKKILKRKRITQKELAEGFELSENMMTNYLTGRTRILAEQIPLFAKLLRASYDDLFNWKDLNTLEEPMLDYDTNTDYKALCNQKDETIKAKDESINLLKGQIEYLKSKIEG